MANIQASLRTRLALGQDLSALAREIDYDIEANSPGPVYATLFPENVRWVAERKSADDKRIKEAGIQIVDLGAGHRKLAYDAYWEALAKRAPEPIKELRAASDALR